MFKQISKLLTFLFIIVMSSCQKDELNESITETKNTNLVKEFTFKQATQKTEFNNAYNKVSYGLRKINKNTRDSDSNFIIDSTTVKQITINGKTTYTMAIRRATPTPTYFENLIVQVSNIDSTRAFISKFTPDQKLVYHEAHHATSFHGTSEIKEIVYNSSMFHNKIIKICITSMYCNYGGSEHPAGENCKKTYPIENCVSIDVGGGSGGAIGSNPGGTGSTGGTGNSGSSGSTSNGNGDSGTVVTAPVIPTYTSVNLSTALSLNMAQQNWIATHPQTKKQLQQFLFANPFNTSNFTLASQIITQMMNNQIFTNINPFLIEDQIDDSALQPCPKAIIDKIKNLQQNDFAAIIAKFGGANAPYDLNINSVLANIISGNLAETYIAPGTNALGINIDISIEHMSTSTKLSIASTILHEFVHAYFLSLLRDQIIGGNITITQNNLGYLWEFYVARTYGTNANLAQHQQIAETYIASIASALQEFQTGNCVSAGVQPQQLYKDLAWGGLTGTVPFNALSTTEQNRINAVILAEENNTTSTVNGVVALPTSQPCN